MIEVSAKTEPRSARRWWRRPVQVLLAGAILYFVLRQVADNWDAITAHDWQVDWLLLAASILVGILTFFALSSVWRVIINGFGHRLDAPAAFRIFYLSNLGRYIPGKVWQLFGVLYLAGRRGIPPEQAGVSFVLAQLFAIPASFLVFVAAVQFEPSLLTDRIAVLGTGAGWIIAAAMVVVCAVIVLWPERILALANHVLRRFGRAEVSFRMDKKVALGIFLGYCVAWILYGLAFWLFVRSVAPGFAAIPAIGAFNASYQIGYLMLFAPGGLGPRELVLGILLTPFAGPLGPAIAVLARLWSIAVEGVAALLALAIRR
jgi:glycosyltransferase 2 family protein